MSRSKPSLACRIHRASSLAANTLYWWRRGYRLSMAWYMAKCTIN